MGKDKHLKYKEKHNRSQKINKKMFSVPDIVKGVRALAQSMIETEGLELIHVEFAREPIGWVLRCYIDRHDGSVSIDDCADISRLLSDILDIALEPWLIDIQKNNTQEIPLPEMFLPSYHLEVSSPGDRRPISRKSDFFRFQGNNISVKVYAAINGQKRFKGMLSQANDSEVIIETEKRSLAIPYDNIRIARLES
ncbi:MAG: Ribosome maturation factor rimP [Candidatus Magnetoglobus multicellularis str. Araruama]|uniref:Ribosome maturation factor RimP n=1 Tax=Candidatus Magnetoglobus multicellularis str. Araruama TaxID=890399 RepID=A0A1V1PB61_9BACT|nr:MAG: Ribosome maturation factor rimP [Candidatus Magnetoglobus multicellularis str. Araruama]